MILFVTWLTWRRGLTSAKTVVELRHDERLKGKSQLQVVANGQPLPVLMMLDYGNRQEEQQSDQATIADFGTLRRVSLQLPNGVASTLKVWTHHLPAEGGSLGLPARITLAGNGQAPVVLTTGSETGQCTALLPGAACQLEIVLKK